MTSFSFNATQIHDRQVNLMLFEHYMAVWTVVKQKEMDETLLNNDRPSTQHAAPKMKFDLQLEHMIEHATNQAFLAELNDDKKGVERAKKKRAFLEALQSDREGKRMHITILRERYFALKPEDEMGRKKWQAEWRSVANNATEISIRNQIEKAFPEIGFPVRGPYDGYMFEVDSNPTQKEDSELIFGK